MFVNVASMTLSAYESPGQFRNRDRRKPDAAGGEAPQSLAWLWFVVPVFAGVVLGIVWWLLAPGGANLLTRDPAMADPAAPLTRLPRDLVLAALLLLAGCFTAVLLDSKVREPGQVTRTLLAAAGGLAGAVAAWQLGVLSGRWWGPAGILPDGEDGFTLRSLVVLLIWPGAVALIGFVFNLIGLLGKRPAA